ncbi:MAG TPA: purine-nucleoside phosphorylase [Polyangia bacterium]|jgi:purine-nucleoside phosphorylase
MSASTTDPTPGGFAAVEPTVRHLRERLGGRTPSVGLILGSGLGDYAETLAEAIAIDYASIPDFPISRVIGHAGRLRCGIIAGRGVAALQGRVHYYEGWPLAQVVFPARVLVALGCRTLIITNAAGGINQAYRPGDLVLIRDHLNLSGQNPLRGDNDERFGPRFPDMSEAYAPELREHALRCGAELGLTLHEGVYAMMSGPSYETPAEIRMLATVGADLCGMSTVPEVIAAHHMGAQCLGISCVTNLAAGISPTKLRHAEVTEVATRIRRTFADLLTRIITTVPEAPAT